MDVKLIIRSWQSLTGKMTKICIAMLVEWHLLSFFSMLFWVLFKHLNCLPQHHLIRAG